MSHLRLSFLGPPEVFVGEKPVRFPTRKTLALLAYLVVEGGLQPREKLMALFWPENDEQRGRGALRITLFYLRRELDKAHPGSGLEYLHIAPDVLGFNPESAYSLDVQMLERTTGRLPHFDPEEVQALLTSVRGPFMEGFSPADAPEFDTWITYQREHIHQKLTLLYDQLTRRLLERRDYPAGIAMTGRWVAHDSLNEAAYRRLMECQALSGNPAAAQQVYDTCRRLLAEELGITPAAATRSLMENIRKERLRPRPAIPDNPTFFLPLPFVGRRDIYAHLTNLFQTAQQGRPQIGLITGEPGIGKSRVAAEFLQWAGVQGADVLSGRAFEAGGRLPYQPVVDALRARIDAENAPEDLLGDVWLAELSRLLPELRERYPDLPVPAGDDPAAGSRLLEAVARLGTALVHKQMHDRPDRENPSLVFFLDDLQWVDAASLDMLHYCLQAWVKQPLPFLLLFTLREEEAAANPPLVAWLSQLPRVVPVTRLALEPITAAETNDLVQALAEQAAAPLPPQATLPAFGQWLYQETAGQPFFIHETLQALREQGPAGADAWGERPGAGLTVPGIRRLIMARVNRLPATALNLLAAAAVLGRPSPFSHLCRVAGLDEDSALPALDMLLQSQLLLEQALSANPYTTGHDKIRDVVYTEAGAARRRLFHRRAFAVLEAEQAAPAELAHHAHAAFLAEAAIRYSIAAGDEALALFAVRNAVAYYEQARNLLHEHPEHAAEPAQVHMLTRLGRAYELAGDYPQAEATGREMLALARRLEKTEMACTALNRLAGLAIYTNHLDSAAVYLEEAAAIAGQHGHTRLLAETEWSLAQLTHHHYDMATSKVHSARALALAQEIEDDELIAGSLNSLAYAHMLLGELDDAGKYIAEARQRYAALGNRALEADCLTGEGGIHIFNAQSERGIQLARQGEAIYREIENPWGLLYSSGWLVAGLLDTGRYEEALTAGLEAAGMAENLPSTPVTVWNRLMTGNAYRALLDVEQATATHQKAAAGNESAPLPAFAWYIAAECCADAVMRGDWPAAYRLAQEVLRLRFYAAIPQIVLPQWAVTAALLKGGDEAAAREDLQRNGALWERLPRFRVAHLRARAVLAEWDGDPAGAAACLTDALALAESLALPGEQQALLGELRRLGPRPVRDQPLQ